MMTNSTPSVAHRRGCSWRRSPRLDSGSSPSPSASITTLLSTPAEFLRLCDDPPHSRPNISAARRRPRPRCYCAEAGWVGVACGSTAAACERGCTRQAAQATAASSGGGSDATRADTRFWAAAGACVLLQAAIRSFDGALSESRRLAVPPAHLELCRPGVKLLAVCAGAESVRSRARKLQSSGPTSDRLLQRQ